MPADRFIHPRAGHSRKVSMLTDLEFRVWVQCVMSADDFGVLRASAITLQADNDHLANRPQKMVQRCVEAVIKAGLFDTFDHQGRRYMFQPTWQEFQKVSYPRGTNNPSPPADALARCDAPTQELFKAHPGGKGRKFPKRLENVSETDRKHSEPDTEKSPTTRAGAPAERLRLTANANGLGSGERLDVAFLSFQEAYPPSRRKGGFLAQQAFIDAVERAGGLAAVMDALANHKASEQWQESKLIPSMDKWLSEERWRQRLDPPKPAGATDTKSKWEASLPEWAQKVRAAKAVQS
jgi:hypothetical protein